MKLKGFTNEGLQRIARSIRAQEDPAQTKAAILIGALESGDYTIEDEGECLCNFYFDFENDQVVENLDSDECWEGRVLRVNGEPIAENIRYGEFKMLTDIIDEEDIPYDVWDEMRISEGESLDSDVHEDNKRKALIDWLNELVGEGYLLMKDKGRGFANEYTLILVSPEAEKENIDDDWDELDVDDWADAYLYRGDAATQVYTSTKVVE